jgi:DNA polymerase
MTPDDRRELLDLVTATRAELEWWRATGIEDTPLAPDAPDASAVVDTRAEALALVSREAPAIPPTEPPQIPVAKATAKPETGALDFLTEPDVRASATLPELRAAIGDCTRCKLAPHRTQIVYGVGNPDADLVFVGEAPGRDEDLRGEPFVGKAGQLLTEIIVKGMKIRRQDVYIANIIKCRPPQNRNPEPDEIVACEPFLKRQLAIIKPKVIVALGTFAAQCLLRTRTPITRLRGVWADYEGIPLMPTFHPAYLLRNPGDKRLVWNDIQQVMSALGLR